ncbi:hypothetical protein TRV_06874 [Trichophyton verrucosum HKI 0517]|uniref:Uncharacterized protein n=1 Tax=Trichophyton verrucosum (strain HKI 0517) TaxID=663202 RepID=D4DI66_TRIVH|nr:uncharacterized protein TRV_06874 [Trichophyton verrucosum HKI 0517]EFE38450.1 hypothetical protein TRV_06874 [Trichophyton verrucosum HKI 0517]
MAGIFNPNIVATSYNRYSSHSNTRLKSPFTPSGARRLGQVRLPELPYATPEDLLALKINSSGLRATIEKRRVDAADADALAEMLLSRGPIVLTPEQRRAAQGGLEDLLKYSTKDEAWWRRALQL